MPLGNLKGCVGISVRYILDRACVGQDVRCRGAVGVLQLAGALLVPGVPGGAPQGKAVATQLVWSCETPAGIPEQPPAPLAGSAPRLSSVLPFKQSSLAVMARSHGDEQ